MMSSSAELLKKVRAIEIKSRGLSNQLFSGEYHSAFKGRGMAFSEVREYQPGDDIRSIDWNVTARFNHPYVKVFEEERELTVMLLVDISPSGYFGTKSVLKTELMAELSAVLAVSAMTNNDKIGLILFSDRIERFIAPRKGKTHVMRIIREILDSKPLGRGTDLQLALRFFTNTIKKRCSAFLLSDFLAPDFTQAFQVASRKHDLVGLRISDRRERELPDMGLVCFRDAEEGSTRWIDTSDKSMRIAYAKASAEAKERTADLFRKTGTDLTDLETGMPYVRQLSDMFRRREKR